MDARVAAGFPRAGGARSGRRFRGIAIPRPQLAVLGGLASLLIGLVVVVSLGGGSATQQKSAASSAARGGASTASGPVQVESAPSAKAPAGTLQRSVSPADAATPSVTTLPAPAPAGPGFVEPPIGGAPAIGGRNRKVERSAALTLAAPREKLGQVGNQVVAVTDRYRGFVMSSSVTSATGDQASGYFDLRIPVGNLQPALRDLSQLADVRSRTENAGDITASFVGARTRRQELNASRTSLLKQLANAQTTRAADAIHAQLRIVNAQLDAVTRELTALRRRTSYASVSVSLVPKQGGSTGGGIGTGARSLRDSLIDAANLALRVLGVAIPIAILIALLWAGNSVVTRRRREAALDSRL
jgi:hypothetical protein